MTTVTRPIHFAIQGRRKRATVAPAPEPVVPPGRVPRVARLMALAIRFDELLRDGAVPNLSELARLVHVTQPRMTQIMNLLHLAPDIQEKILFLPLVERGRDLLTERDLRRVTAVLSWKEQRRLWRALTGGNATMPSTPAPPHSLEPQSELCQGLGVGGGEVRCGIGRHQTQETAER